MFNRKKQEMIKPAQRTIIEHEKIVPIYLNQRIVFDLLAIIENGFSKMYSVQKKTVNSSNVEANIEAEIGTSNTFGFLSAKLGSKLGTQAGNENEENFGEERIHTPASLFSRLLSYLKSDTHPIATSQDYHNIQTGDFITFKGEIKENQVIKLFDSFSYMISLAGSFNIKDNSKKQPIDKKLPEQIKALADSMRIAGIIDLICTTKNDLEIVLQTETKYFENQYIGVIEEGEYQVLAKVIKIPKDSNDCVNLMRNTSLSLAKDSLMQTLLQNFNSETAAVAGLQINNVKTTINGMLVIPIAIYS